MKCKDCKITCDGVEIATISCGKGELSIKCTGKGKEMCKDLFQGCC